MKLLIASLANESNTFSPFPVGRDAFAGRFLSRTPTAEPAIPQSAPLHVWREMGEAKGWQVVEALGAYAQPAGVVVREVYEELRDIVLGEIEREKPDLLLMAMHGAMVADGYDDCEGDTMARARALMGPDAVIGLEIDPHSQFTPAMLENASAIVAYKEYPHVDIRERAADLFRLAADAVEGRARPVMRAFDCQMIGMYPTQDGPMRRFVDDMLAAEGVDGILSLSLIHGFPYGDTAVTGTQMLAIADGDAGGAAAAAEAWGRRLWDMREALRLDWPDIDGALDRVEAAQAFPVVLADTADNAGGGAASDSTFVLARVLERGMKDVALGPFWDPVLVEMCRDAGEGARMRVRLGGKCSAASGDPLDLDVVVRGIREDMRQFGNGDFVPFGTGVWLEAEGVHVIVNSLRTQALNPSLFTEPGLDIAGMKALVVKSTNHFHAEFAKVAAEVIHVASPGALSADFANIPYRKRAPEYWPRIENPFD